MAHASFIDNNMVDDDGIPVMDLQFSDHRDSKFCDQIQQLTLARIHIPAGWHCIFDHAVRSLNAVNCPKLDGIEISEFVFGSGASHIAAYRVSQDKVVRGILSCLAKRSACTCQVCGRGYGAVYKKSSGNTLCARCYVQTDFATELGRWLSVNHASQMYENLPLIELDSLPENIKLLIPKSEVKTMRLRSDGKEVSYVTSHDKGTHLQALEVRKRCLHQFCTV